MEMAINRYQRDKAPPFVAWMSFPIFYHTFDNAKV
jgi:hypothetical protein